MKTERKIAELIFDKFRQMKCIVNYIVPMRTIRFGLMEDLNPKEREVFYTVFCGLQALNYFTYKKGNLECICLTQKGYDYIYDDDLISKMQNIPWIIPEYENTNWEKAYNRLWKMIGPQDASFYISGPKFLELVNELCDDICCSYGNYIEERRNKDLSTSRVDYYKDLIDHLDEEKRYELYVNIQNYWESKVLSTTNDDSPNMLDNSFSDWKQPTITQEENKEEYHPKVFISYSWDSEEHKKWVKKFADDLKNNGMDVLLDQYQSPGTPLTPFMMNGINQSEKVLIIGTPTYKQKAEAFKGGTNVEHQIINIQIAKNFLTPKFIPILRKGTYEESFTDLIGDRIGIDFSMDDDYDENIKKLIKSLKDDTKELTEQQLLDNKIDTK